MVDPCQQQCFAECLGVCGCHVREVASHDGRWCCRLVLGCTVQEPAHDAALDLVAVPPTERGKFVDVHPVDGFGEGRLLGHRVVCGGGERRRAEERIEIGADLFE